MSAYNMGKLFGAIVGFAVGIILVIIVAKFANKNKKVKTEYDERQKLLRGEGYKYGFYAVLAYAAVTSLLGIANVSLPMEPSVYGFSYVFVGVVVDVGYCIFHDCYWGLNNNRVKWLLVMLFAAIINIITTVGAILNGEFFNNGMISSPGINMFCSLLLIILAVCVLIKSIIENGEVHD